MLFIHGTKDDFVPTYMVHELYDACSTDKDLLLVEGAGHAESYPTDSAAYEAKVKSFIDKYIAVESKAWKEQQILSLSARSGRVFYILSSYRRIIQKNNIFFVKCNKKLKIQKK